jgi:hypothetical protein
MIVVGRALFGFIFNAGKNKNKSSPQRELLSAFKNI